MRFSRRSARPDLDVARGERLLAWAGPEGPDGPDGPDGPVVGGSRDALYLRRGQAPVRRLPWEQVEAADWDAETDTLRVSEVGSWGEQRVEHELVLHEATRLLELVRERVTASMVYQHQVSLGPRRGLRVVARRAPSGREPVRWFYEYDEGVDPADPAVREAAEQALALARQQVEGG
ncbi:hypothetical protein BKA08_003676 [Nocardioides marinisabuli]|uniref:Uncharacterized protein n=1 Tax=Nocardioides marinisabuli TaxID=419476 RepID=A0A7Y9JTD6_9ACTN|nr:hypothetical protein [Nocardioides marinisabuli]NYD59438.1 hypothetical protein [Nocardioides marinisabuli]